MNKDGTFTLLDEKGAVISHSLYDISQGGPDFPFLLVIHCDTDSVVVGKSYSASIKIVREATTASCDLDKEDKMMPNP